MNVSIISSSFLAGMLTIFSPCVLPMVPFVAKSSMQKSKWGPLFLSLGLAMSFSLTTYVIASSGKVLGLSADMLKTLSALLLLLASLLFIFPTLTDKVSLLLAPLNNKLQKFSFKQEKSKRRPFYTEFLNGVFLGPVWAPCSGPTLAVIIGIIINTPEIKFSILLLAIFSLGAIIPILFISYGAKSLINKFLSVGIENSKKAKIFLGVICAFASIMILTGFDKKIESALLTILPESITNLSLII